MKIRIRIWKSVVISELFLVFSSLLSFQTEWRVRALVKADEEVCKLQNGRYEIAKKVETNKCKIFNLHDTFCAFFLSLFDFVV